MSQPASGTIFMTGGTGFIGSHLVNHLTQQGFKVHAPHVDVLNCSQVTSELKQEKWAWILHLGGISSPDVCEKDKYHAYSVNVTGSVLLARTMHELGIHCPLLFASTAQIYTPETSNSREMRFVENSPIDPQNFYALTKWHAELALQDLHSRKQLGNLLILRLFNHTHKSQGPLAFLPRIYNELQNAKNGQLQLSVGNIEVFRDIGMLEDLLEIFSRLLQKPMDQRVEIFNVCSGNSRKIRDLALALAQAMNVKLELVTDPSRVRANDPLYVAGNSDKLFKHLGWSPPPRTDLELIQRFLKD